MQNNNNKMKQLYKTNEKSCVEQQNRKKSYKIKQKQENTVESPQK